MDIDKYLTDAEVYDLVVPEGAVKMKVVGHGSTSGLGYVQEIMAID